LFTDELSPHPKNGTGDFGGTAIPGLKSETWGTQFSCLIDNSSDSEPRLFPSPNPSIGEAGPKEAGLEKPDWIAEEKPIATASMRPMTDYTGNWCIQLGVELLVCGRLAANAKEVRE
jgi:hypothetical protein